ncbi:plectin-like isoform X5 [Betta splendens]|uniref:Plectin-like isoform X5 n=1 Tax=Betta splendens TaxID=158456 RepID=A0A9W2XRN8_BETSP|nr:plectin-like isoform X5 [Betta splendens]
MSYFGSQQGLNTNRRSGSKSDLAGGGTYHYARSDIAHGSGNGYDPYYPDGYRTYSYSKVSTGGMGGGMMSGMMSGTGGGMMSGMMSGTGGGMMSGMMSGTGGGMMSGTMSGTRGGILVETGGGMAPNITTIHKKAMAVQNKCVEYLTEAEYALQSDNASGDAERYMALAKDGILQLKGCASELKQLGQPNDNIAMTLERCKDHYNAVNMAIKGTLRRRRSTRGSSGVWEEPGRTFDDAIAWISQQKGLIQTAPWGDDPASIGQQLVAHQKYHSSIQRSPEVDRAKDELLKKGDKANLRTLEQEFDNLQRMSLDRTQQLKDLEQILQDICTEIMWVNDKEEEELVFDWGDKDVAQYIPKKQESYSKLMSALEVKEKDLTKLKVKVDALLKNNHPAADKIEAYQDTLQTQWSWLLQITKCIHVHLKENAAYGQFFKEATETYNTLQKEHETVRKTFTCDKNTSLEDLQELLRGLEREKEKIRENKSQVQHLVNKSKSIVRLKPRNPEEKSSSPVIVKALCEFKQDQRVICKDDEAILKDNSQRSRWQVTGPGGLDMLVPSVCLIVPPPNPLSISVAAKNEQYYEAILSIWNQLYVNVKSLISWQYCLLDIKHINSLTMSMLAQMRPEEYRQIIKNMETHYEEFKLASHGSQMFADEDKRSIENQFNGAQAHYDQLVVQLPTYVAQQEQLEIQQEPIQPPQLFILQQQPVQQVLQQTLQQTAVEVDGKRVEDERRRTEVKKVSEKKTEVKKDVSKEHVIKKEVVKLTKSESTKKRKSSSSSSAFRSLSELHTLRLKLEAAEGSLSQHVHICLGDDGVHDCALRIAQLEVVQRDIAFVREEYLRLREHVPKELEGTDDPDKAQFLSSELRVIDQKLESLESSSSAYLQRLQAVKDMLESVAHVEDIVKVYEARLTEKETTSLSPSEVQDYMSTLQNIKAELDQKRDALASMEAHLAEASHWNSQVGGAFHRCDVMLSKYTEQVGLLSDRWMRIQAQINTRLQDLELYLPQLQQYKQTSTSLIGWIDGTRKKQDALQATKTENVQAVKDLINSQKALNTEIKAKRETVESVLKDNDVCMHSVKDYETDLATYTSGLETLLNIPIKRTMLSSPTMDLNQEAAQLQTRYMELLTLSGDYYKYLGELLKNMEELKIRNTRIDLLEEELRLLRENIEDRNSKNKSLEDAVARYQLELSHSQNQLLSMEEVKRNTALQCSATKESLDSTQNQLGDLNDQVTRLNYMLEEEKRKRRLAEERYTQQQQEYEGVLRKRQTELETVSWSKVEIEKSVVSKDHEIEQLRRQLSDEGARVKELQKEISKTTAMMKSIQSQYTDIIKERDALLLKLQLTEKERDRLQALEEEINRIKLSLDSELRNRQRLQDENERVKRDLSYWKDQNDSKQSLIRQYDIDKERMDREKNSLRSEIERLMRELRELDGTYKSRLSAIQKEMIEVTTVRQTTEPQLMRGREPPTLDDSGLIFDGVRKQVTADQLLECGVLEKPTFNQLVKGQKTVPEVSVDKKVSLKGTGPIAGVVFESPKGPGSFASPLCKLTFTEAKRENLLPPDSIDLLLDAQAATGHIIDPRTNQKLTVEEACNQGVVDEEDQERLLAAEAAAVGYGSPGANKPISVFQAMKKGLIDRNTTLRLLQAQESVGGILDPILSVFLPKDTAIERNLLDDDICRALNQRPELYLDPDSEVGVTYMAMKRRCKVEPHTGLLLLPVPEKVDPSKLIFDGVRKPVTAKKLLDCGVLDRPTFKDLEKGKKTVPEVSTDKRINLKGTGPIAGVIVGDQGKMSLSEAKKKMLLPNDSADLLLEAQAATGHIIDPRNNQKLTVEEACTKGIADIRDQDKLLAAEAAAVGYKDPSTAKPLSVFEAMRRGLIDRKTGLRVLQAQESVGGILDPNLSVFLPKDTAIKHSLLDENLSEALNQNPTCYIDPETEREISYGALKRRCKIEPHTGLLLLPITGKQDPSKLTFDGVRKPVTAQDLLDCGVLDRPTFNQLIKGEKTVPEVSVDKKVPLKGTGSIAGVAAGPLGKMSLSQAKKEMLIPPDSADLLLDAQAATGHIIDPINNKKLTVEEACASGVVDISDKERLLAAEAAAVGFRDPSTTKPLSVSEAVKKGLIDRKSGLRLLQAQESAGGILDPNLSVFLPKDTAIKRKLLDDDLCRALNQRPELYLDPESEEGVTYMSIKNKCKVEPHTGLLLLPVPEKVDPSKLIFDGVRKPVTAKKLLDCGVLDRPTFKDLETGKKTVPEVSIDKSINLKGTGPIAGVIVGDQGKMSLSEAKKKRLLPNDSADLLLEAQAATGHIIDPRNNQKLTVEEACTKGIVDIRDQDKLLAAEAAAVGYKDPSTAKPLSVFEAMRRGLIDRKTGLRVLQAQESVGGILDPNISVFLPKDTAIKHSLLDENLSEALKQNPACYIDPETERDISYGALKKRCTMEPHTGLLLLPITGKQDPSKLTFDGVRKPVTAQDLLDCGVLDRPTFNQLIKGEKTIPEVSVDKKVPLKGTGSIAGVAAGPLGKMSLSQAKKEMLIPPDSADLLLDAQAATGHIIDPINNKKLTVEEACASGVVDISDKERLLAAEAAAVGFRDPSTTKPLSVSEAVKKGLIDRKSGLRLLQAQESAGGILDPNLSVFLPKDTAIKRKLLDDDICRALNQRPELYLDPESEEGVTYMSIKNKCKVEPHTGLLLLPVPEKVDPSKLIFDGVRKPVTAKKLLDCGVLDRPTFKALETGKKTVPEVSIDKSINLKGTGPIAGVIVGDQGKMSLSEAKKKMLLPNSADLLLEAQAATGHIIDPGNNQKLTVEEACTKGIVDIRDQDKLLAAEAAAVGYKDPSTAKPLSVFEAMRRGLIDRKTGLRVLQAQESVGGILDPNLSVFLPKDTAIKHSLLDENLSEALNQKPACYIDPETERDISYGALKKRCTMEPHTGLLLLPITGKQDPSKLTFDGVRKPVTAQDLLDCGVLDRPTFNQLIKGEKTVPEVSVDKKVPLKGTGSIAGVAAGPLGKMSLSQAKKEMLIPPDSADLLLDAQAATGHIIDPINNKKLTVEEACASGVVDISDKERLLAAEAAAVGYKDPSTAKPLSVFEAMKKGLIDRKAGLRLLQAQESVGGILDPNLSVFLHRHTAMKRNLLDENLGQALNQSPTCYLDPDTGRDASYGTLKERCKTEPTTGLILLPITAKPDPSKLIFDGLRKSVTAQQLLDCGVLDKPTFNKLLKGEKTVAEVAVDKKVFLKGTGSVAGVAAGPMGKMSFTEAKKKKMMSSDSANMLLSAQAATGHIIDPRTNQKLTVKEACTRGVVDKEDESMLYAAEAAAIGYRDPSTAKLLSAGQAMKKGLIDKDTTLRILQAQESLGGILDPVLSIFLPKETAVARNLIDEDLHRTLNQSPECYLDPDTDQATTYVSLKKKCRVDPGTDLLLLAEPKEPLTVQGLRCEVSVIDLVDANLLNKAEIDQLNQGKLTRKDIEDRLHSYLKGSTCIAGLYDEASDKVMPFYQAMKDGLLRPGTTLELLEAQAASGFIVDPVNSLYLTVSEAYNKRLFGPEFKDSLLSAERAVTGYKLPGTEKIISLFQAIERGLVEKGHGIRLLEAQIASGGIIDHEHSHRIEVDVAYKRGYFNEEMNKILTDPSDDTKGFFDPNTEENLTYLELKQRCITDKKTGLILLPILSSKKQESTLKNTKRKRRVVIVDPETNKEMTIREAYNKGYIDYNTYLELAQQECEWEEITITAPDGSTRFVIVDRSTGKQYDITELLEKGVIDQSVLNQYRSSTITLTQFADIITNKTQHGSLSSSTTMPLGASATSSVTSSSTRTSTTSLGTSLGTSISSAAKSVGSATSTAATTFSKSELSSSSTSSKSVGSTAAAATATSTLGRSEVSSTSLTTQASSFMSKPLSPTLAKITTTRTTTITEENATFSSLTQDSPDTLKHVSSVSFTLTSPVEAVDEQEPVGAIFDTDSVEKISITEARNRDLVDSITAQRLLEAQACTGGIVNPTNGRRVSIQEASRLGIITEDMANKLKPAQKAFFGFEDVKTKKKMSAALAMKEMWLPYEAGQRFLEFQFVTGGLYDPEMGCRRTIEDALKMGWLDGRAAQKLQDVKQHTKNLTCPKSKLKISYKEALDNCMLEETTGVKMLQASAMSSKGISSPYNVSSAPGSHTGSRSGSRHGSRRGSLDLGTVSSSSLLTTRYSRTSFTTFSSAR